MRLSFRAVLPLVLLIGPPVISTAEACFCPPIPPCSAAWRAEAVFIATAVEDVEEHLGGHLYWTVQRLDVTRILRGTVSPSVTIRPPIDRPSGEQIAASLSQDKVMVSNSCGFEFRRGEDYLVYATRATDGRWTTSLCSGTKPLTDATTDLDYFASLPAAAPTGRVYGSIQRTILDPSDPTKTRDVPAVGISVTLSTESSRMTATTNGQGKLDVRLPPGDYGVTPIVPESVRVYGPNHITLAARGCAPVDFSLISNGRVEGQVVREDGSGVPGISVGVVPVTIPDGRLSNSFTTAPVATTDERGRFKIEAILPGTYLLAVNPRFFLDLRLPYAPTYYPAGGRADAEALEIGDGERKTDYTITVRPFTEASILGRVVFNDDQPAVGASIVVYPAAARGHIVSSAATDNTGAFRLRVPAGVTYLIRAGARTPDGYRETETEVFVAQQVNDLRISIHR